jgi:hypothetical protein
LASRITASSVRLAGSAQRREPVRLCLGQAEQILTPGVALGRINDAALGQSGINGAVGAGRYGDTVQGSICLRNVDDCGLGFGQLLFGILNSPPQKILVRSFTNRRVDPTSKAANPKAGGRGNCGQPNGLAEIGLAAATKGAWN